MDMLPYGNRHRSTAYICPIPIIATIAFPICQRLKRYRARANGAQGESEWVAHTRPDSLGFRLKNRCVITGLPEREIINRIITSITYLNGHPHIKGIIDGPEGFVRDNIHGCGKYGWCGTGDW